MLNAGPEIKRRSIIIKTEAENKKGMEIYYISAADFNWSGVDHFLEHQLL